LDSAQAQSVDLMSPIHDAAARGNIERLRDLVSVKSTKESSKKEWEISEDLINQKDEAKNTVRPTEICSNNLIAATALGCWGRTHRYDGISNQ
jgi:hypothetical protein